MTVALTSAHRRCSCYESLRVYTHISTWVHFLVLQPLKRRLDSEKLIFRTDVLFAFSHHLTIGFETNTRCKLLELKPTDPPFRISSTVHLIHLVRFLADTPATLLRFYHHCRIRHDSQFCQMTRSTQWTRAMLKKDQTQRLQSLVPEKLARSFARNRTFSSNVGSICRKCPKIFFEWNLKRSREWPRALNDILNQIQDKPSA